MMAEIRLSDVTRTFSRPSAFERAGAHGRGLAGNQEDRAFAERVADQARREADGHAAAADILALDHVNLKVPDGLTCAIVGPSGCGKSTLLRVVAGLDTTYAGTVYYDDQDVREVPVKDRYIGMVFQNYALYPHFAGHGNLSFFFWAHKAPDAEAQERIRATSELMGFGFDALLDRKPGTLSGGQQQRLAIARALVRNPRLFLFDEPLSNLDAKLRQQTRIEIKRLLRRFQITALYVTHDQDEAVALGDLIAVMRDGRVEQAGAYADLLDEPANVFVAGFLGRHPMNLVSGAVTDDGYLQGSGVSLALPAALRGRLEPGRSLTLGVRPEHGRLAPPAIAGQTPAGKRAAWGDADLHLGGEVEMIEPDFARQTQTIFLRSGDLNWRLLTSREQGVRVGETLDALFPVEHLYLFDGKSGVRMRQDLDSD
jgi:ABC-type sugar transport system ATPase subunit